MKTTFIQLLKFNTKFVLEKNLQVFHWDYFCVIVLFTDSDNTSDTAEK